MTLDERAILWAVAERLIPRDEHGPSAAEAGPSPSADIHKTPARIPVPKTFR